MAPTTWELTTDRSTHDALQVLEILSGAAQIRFDRTQAARALSEAQRAIPGEDGSTWSRRMVEVGESLHLRIRAMEASVDEVLVLIQQGVPLATYLQEAGGELTWLVLTEMRGRKVKVLHLDNLTEHWASVSQLRIQLSGAQPNHLPLWVLGHAALACNSPIGESEHGHTHITPLSRLLHLLRPETRDLWMILVFSVVVGLLALASPIAVEALVNTVAFGQYLQPVVVLAAILFTFLAFAGGFRTLITFIVEVLQRRLFIRVVEDLAYRLPRVQQPAFDQAHGPELMNRFFDIVTVQKTISSLLLDGVAILLQTVIGMAVLAFYHPFLLGFDVALLLLIAFIVIGLGRGAVASAVKESKAKYAVAGWLQELARHPTAFKMHSGAGFALDRADQLAIHWLDARRKHFHVVLRQILFVFGLQALAATALLGLGGWLVIQGELTLGQLVAAELIVMLIVGSFAKLGKHMESFYDLLASVDKLGHLFDLPIEPHDKLFHLSDADPAQVQINRVTYRYGKRAVLQDVELALASGETVAVLGPAGSGKSTLIDLLCGIRQPEAGHLELDGIDLREMRKDSLRDHLGVSRAIEIFQGSIAENIHLNRPHLNASDVRDALEAVGLLEELHQLPEGLNTQLQTNGMPLTSSQAFRLMLARAIVGRPRLLLIDGTLDALPDALWPAILQRLTRPKAPWTLLVTTGRPAIAQACGRVVILRELPASQGG